MYGLGDDIQELIQERNELKMENTKLKHQLDSWEKEAQKVAIQCKEILGEIQNLRGMIELARLHKENLEKENLTLKTRIKLLELEKDTKKIEIDITMKTPTVVEQTCGLS